MFSDQDLETKTAENTRNINEKKASIETVPSEVEQNTTDFERDGKHYITVIFFLLYFLYIFQ